MRRTAAIALLTLLLAGAASAAGPFGPAGPPAAPEERGVGAGVFGVVATMEPDEGNFSAFELTRTLVYLEGFDTYLGIGAEGAGFLRLGAADFDDGADFQGGFVPFGQVGIRDVWYATYDRSFKVGTVLLGSYYGSYEETETFRTGFPVTVKIKPQWDISLAVPVQWGGEMSRLLLFGGPFLTYGQARVGREIQGATETATYEEKDVAGLYAGLRVRIAGRFFIEGEAQFRGTVSGGLSACYVFE